MAIAKISQIEVCSILAQILAFNNRKGNCDKTANMYFPHEVQKMYLYFFTSSFCDIIMILFIIKQFLKFFILLKIMEKVKG